MPSFSSQHEPYSPLCHFMAWDYTFITSELLLMGFLLLSNPVVNSTAFKITALTVALEPFCWNLLFHHILGWWRRLIFFHRVFFFFIFAWISNLFFLGISFKKIEFSKLQLKRKASLLLQSYFSKSICVFLHMSICTSMYLHMRLFGYRQKEREAYNAEK